MKLPFVRLKTYNALLYDYEDLANHYWKRVALSRNQGQHPKEQPQPDKVDPAAGNPDSRDKETDSGQDQ